MAKLTKFTLSPAGDLVYKSTGRLAPSSYTFRKNTVYGADGRRIGSLSRKLTKKEKTRIAKAEQNRIKRGQVPKRKVTNRPRKPSPRKPTQQASQQYGEDWDQFNDDDFPDPDGMIIEEFAQRVRDAALSVAPQWLQDRIRALSTEAIWAGYQEDAYVFELYFKYHSSVGEPRKSDISVWLYQFINRIEQYM